MLRIQAGRAVLRCGLREVLRALHEACSINKAVTIIIQIILERVAIDVEHVGGLHETSFVLDWTFATIMLIIHMILGKHWTLVTTIMLSNCTVLGLVRLMRHPQFNICHAAVLEVTICILLFVIILSRW